MFSMLAKTQFILFLQFYNNPNQQDNFKSKITEKIEEILKIEESFNILFKKLAYYLLCYKDLKFYKINKQHQLTIPYYLVLSSLEDKNLQKKMSQLTSQASIQNFSHLPKAKRLPSFLFPDIDEGGTNSQILKQSVISNFEHTTFSIMCNAPFSQLIFFQALATFIFLFGCSCLYNEQDFQIQALYAIFLLFAICISGSLTGANINPSITLSNYLRKENKYKAIMIPVYFTGQFIGVLLALVMAKYVNGGTFEPIVPDDTMWITIVREGVNQMMGTVIMVFFILEITNPNTTFIENQISGFLSIVLFYYLAIVLCPGTNSYAINFAIILGINLSASVFEGNHAGWQWIWVYLFGQIAGVLIATLFYDKIFQPIIKRLREARRQSINFSSQYTLDEEDED